MQALALSLSLSLLLLAPLTLSSAAELAYLQAASASAVSGRAAPEASPPARQSSMRSALQAALSRPAPAGEMPRAITDVLAFKPDPAVTVRERERTVEHLARQPNGGGKAADAVRSGALWREFDGLLRRYGYSPHNLGDVLAAHLLISWEVVNARDSTQVPLGQRAVRRQLAGPLSRVETIAGLDDAGKQAQAERTAYMTMIAAVAYQELKDGHDPAQLKSLQRNLRDSVGRSGINLERLELTDGGLVER